HQLYRNPASACGHHQRHVLSQCQQGRPPVCRPRSGQQRNDLPARRRRRTAFRHQGPAAACAARTEPSVGRTSIWTLADMENRNANPAWPADEDAFVRVDDVVKIYGDVVAVQSVNLSVRRREIFALLGSSGCGKSTLLRMLAGFEEPTSGRIYLDGEDITALAPYRRPVNMMFQSYALFPHMTVEANVAFGLKQEGVPRNEVHERVFEALDLVQMAGYSRRKPHQLSGGQQQRVALARSLVKRPKLLLLDEPMSALDKQIRQKTQIELVRILDQVGVTCIMVTHDQDEAMTMADRLAVMTEGQIVQCGTPQEVYEFPNSRFVAGFI